MLCLVKLKSCSQVFTSVEVKCSDFTRVEVKCSDFTRLKWSVVNLQGL